jgi:phenylacetate-CoA ligase
VYDQYGSCEVWWLASQCGTKQDLHIYNDVRHIEFTDEQGKPVPTGEFGSVVITDLENYCFPIIRYVNDDVSRALYDKCPCGINLPLMDKVSGRMSDLIKLPDGTYLDGNYMGALFGEFPEVVKAYQVRQKKDYSIDLLYVPVPDAEVLSKALVFIENQLVKKTKSQVVITLKEVKEIPHDRGKLHCVISDVD